MTGSVRQGPQRRGWFVLPIAFFLTYLTFTVFLFFAGPWPYPLESAPRLYLFLAAAHVSLALGYFAARKVRPAAYGGRWNAAQLVKASIAVNLALLIPTLMFRTGGAMPDLAAAIADPGAAYASSGYFRATELPIVEYVRFPFGPLLALLLPLMVFYWRGLSWWVRAGAIACVAGVIILFLAMGTNKALADLVLLVPVMLLAAAGARRIRFTMRSAIVFALIFAAAASLVAIQFTNTQSSRPGSAARHAYMPGIRANADSQNFMLRGLNEQQRIGVLGLTAYLSAGYYAIDLSMSKPFEPMYGVGNSMFLYRNMARITGDESWLEAPYPVRIEVDGWSAYGLFSSIYPWIASDVGFPGTIVVVFVIGFFFAVSWRDTMLGANPFAVAMFAQFVIMLFYFPANNQCMQSGETWSAFWMTGIAWWWTRRPQLVGAAQRMLPRHA